MPYYPPPVVATATFPKVLTTVGASFTIANTETRVIGATIPANTLAIGSIFQLEAMGYFSSGATGGTGHFRIRFGATTLTATIMIDLSAANVNNAVNSPVWIRGLVTVHSIGATGSATAQITFTDTDVTTLGTVTMWNNSVAIAGGNVFAAPGGTVDTTQARVLELTYIGGNANSNWNIQHGSLIQLA